MLNSKVLVALIVLCVVVFLLLGWTWKQLQENFIFAPVVGGARPPLAGIQVARLQQLDLWVVEPGSLSAVTPHIPPLPPPPRPLARGLLHFRHRPQAAPSPSLSPSPFAPVIVFFHGNYGNLSHTAPMVRLLSCFGARVVAFDYSGYGSSGGSPSTEQILSDGVLVYDYVRAQWPQSRVILWGHSLGTSVATFVASHLPCDGLVLTAPFYALTELGRDLGRIYYILSLALAPFVNLLPTNAWIRRVDCPVAIIHSLLDGLIPYRHSLQLYEELFAIRAEREGEAAAAASLLLLPTEGNHACSLLTSRQVEELAVFLALPAQLDFCAAAVEAARCLPECR